jgi:predicted RNase H-like nuclease (RuvC/YqgF family)
MLLLSNVVLTQETPYFLVENGDTIGVVLSVEQTQILDNKLELLSLFEDLQTKYKNVDTYYIEVINKNNEKILLQELKIKELISKSEEMDKLIFNLKEQISKFEQSSDICDSIIQNKDKQIELLNEDLRKEKFKKRLSVAGNVVAGILAIIIITK